VTAPKLNASLARDVFGSGETQRGGLSHANTVALPIAWVFFPMALTAWILGRERNPRWRMLRLARDAPALRRS